MKHTFTCDRNNNNKTQQRTTTHNTQHTQRTTHNNDDDDDDNNNNTTHTTHNTQQNNNNNTTTHTTHTTTTTRRIIQEQKREDNSTGYLALSALPPGLSDEHFQQKRTIPESSHPFGSSSMEQHADPNKFSPALMAVVLTFVNEDTRYCGIRNRVGEVGGEGSLRSIKTMDGGKLEVQKQKRVVNILQALHGT